MIIEEIVERVASGPDDWTGAAKALEAGDFAGPEFFEYGEVLDVLLYGDTEGDRDEATIYITPESKREEAKEILLEDLEIMRGVFEVPESAGFTDDGPRVIEVLGEGFVFRGSSRSEPKEFGMDLQIRLLRLYHAELLEIVGYDLKRQGFRL